MNYCLEYTLIYLTLLIIRKYLLYLIHRSISLNLNSIRNMKLNKSLKNMKINYKIYQNMLLPVCLT